MENIVSIIKNIKAGNTSEFALVVNKMHPSLEKYSRLLYKDNKEDTYAELVSALWESIIKMKYFNEEGKCITYLHTAIKLRYLELYKQSKKLHEHEQTTLPNSSDETIQNDDFIDVIIKEDITNLLNKYKGLKKAIFYSILFMNMTDSEIAKKYNISRQYVNRVRRNLCEIMKKYYV
ncbi:sigma-70 family RNA polymerase sigma factor [Lachnospiraceae bacterium 10-1]|nr:sigma-70 family RNA polymerase sigma factor [Lachnospiraceae bacterium 10-1]